MINASLGDVVTTYHHRRIRDHKRLMLFMVIGLFFHAVMALGLSLWPLQFDSKKPSRRFHWVKLSPSRAPIAQKKKSKPAENSLKKDPKSPPLPKGQVVNLPSDNNDDPPKNSRFLSESNHKVKRETRSRSMKAGYRHPTHKPQRKFKLKQHQPRLKQTARHRQQKPPQPQKKSTPTVLRATKMPPLQKHNGPKISKLDGKLQLTTNPVKRQFIPKIPPSPAAAHPIDPFMPSLSTLSQLNGDPANHHLEDVEEGEGTFLNTRSFKYASFFNRIHQGVSQYWDPISEYRRRDPTGKIYGKRSRVTVLQITLKKNGHLAKIDILRSSGVGFLDQAAQRAFRQAQPFQHPPHGLIEPNGMITFPFSFHLLLSQ